MACRLCIIYVREDNDSDVKAMITRLIWTIWTSLSAVPRKAVKFNHSVTHSIVKALELPQSCAKSSLWRDNDVKDLDQTRNSKRFLKNHKDTLYLVMRQLKSVFCEYFGDKWLCYRDSTVLYCNHSIEFLKVQDWDNLMGLQNWLDLGLSYVPSSWPTGLKMGEIRPN